MTARYALAESLNNATVRLGQEVGFDKVAALAELRASPARAERRRLRWAPMTRLRWKWPELTRSLPTAARGWRR